VSAERELLARLQQVLAEADVDVDGLVAAAWEEAQDEVRTTLRRLFTHDLLRRALATFDAPPTGPGAGTVDDAAPADPAPADPAPADPAPAGAPAADPVAADVPEATPPAPEASAVGEVDGTATYLFGIVRADAPPHAAQDLQLPGGGPIRGFEVGSVRAVVCDVDPGAFASLQDPSADDLELLATAAYAHDALLADLAQQGPVLPLRLGTVVADDDTLREVLGRHERTLVSELDRLAGHAEWAVTVHLLEDPSEAATSTGPDEALTGRDYLQRRREALDLRGERWRTQEAVAGAVHATVAGLAVDAEVVGSRPLEEGAPPLLHGVYLVADDRWPELERTVDELRAAHPSASIEISGPWPPYHFTAVELDADDLANP
jgi:hypothetical protein